MMKKKVLTIAIALAISGIGIVGIAANPNTQKSPQSTETTTKDTGLLKINNPQDTNTISPSAPLTKSDSSTSSTPTSQPVIPPSSSNEVIASPIVVTSTTPSRASSEIDNGTTILWSTGCHLNYSDGTSDDVYLSGTLNQGQLLDTGILCSNQFVGQVKP